MKLIKEAIPYIIILVAVILFRSFIATPVRVDGNSMNPTFKNGDILILNKLDKKYERMDVVVFKYNNEKLIKRVIGLPGEKVSVKNNKLYINDELVNDFDDTVLTADFETKVIPSGYYFVLGDNRYDSYDSRYLGNVSANDILGKPIFRILPISKIGKI